MREVALECKEERKKNILFKIAKKFFKLLNHRMI